MALVVEPLRGWGKTAQDCFKFLAHARAARSGEFVSEATRILYSGLSIKLMRANACALLARVPDCESPPDSAAARACSLLTATAAWDRAS